MHPLWPKPFNKTAGSFFVAYHAVLVLTLPVYLLYHPPGTALLVATGVVIALTGVTLTTLYHRYYSHRAFSLGLPAELVLLLLGTLIAQGSAIEWAFDHRRHHKDTEGPGDPHAITRGFWYAHILWILERRPPLDEQMVHDLLARRLLRFQHEHYTAIFITVSVLNSLMLGWISGDWLGGFYVGFLVRIFISHHATFCINSLAHYWGRRTYDAGATAVDNPLCSFITFGEGQHSYHHAFPYDYRIGNRWYFWDPGKWLVWSLSKLGLASGLKRARPDRVRAVAEAVARARAAGA